MIAFKDYLAEMSHRVVMGKMIDSIPKEKHETFRNLYKAHRAKGLSQSAAATYALNMVREDTELSESKYDDEGMLKNMTPERAVRVLERTQKSIGSHVSRGGSVHSWRGSELRMRYDDHRDWLCNKHPKAWEAYCKKHGHHIDHDGSDMFA